MLRCLTLRRVVAQHTEDSGAYRFHQGIGAILNFVRGLESRREKSSRLRRIIGF